MVIGDSTYLFIRKEDYLNTKIYKIKIKLKILKTTLINLKNINKLK